MSKNYSEVIREFDQDLFGINAEIWDKIGDSFSSRINESIDEIDSLKTNETEMLARIRMLEQKTSELETDKATAIDIATKQTSLLNDTINHAKLYKEKLLAAQKDSEAKALELGQQQKLFTDVTVKLSQLTDQLDSQQKAVEMQKAKEELTAKNLAELQTQVSEAETRVKNAEAARVAVCLDKPVELTMDSISFDPTQVVEIAGMALKSAVAHNVDISNTKALNEFLSGWITEGDTFQVSESLEAQILEHLDKFFNENIEAIMESVLPDQKAIDMAKIEQFDKIVESFRKVSGGSDINISESVQEINGLRQQLEDSRHEVDEARRALYKAESELIVESKLRAMSNDKAKYVKNRVRQTATAVEAETMINEAIEAYERDRAAESRQQTLVKKSPGTVLRIDETQFVPSQEENLSDDSIASYARGVKNLKRL